MRSIRARSSLAAVAMLAATLAATAAMPRADALPVTNPGPFVLNATGGNLRVGSQSFDLTPSESNGGVIIAGTLSSDGTITVPKTFTAGPPPQGVYFPDETIPYMGSNFTVKILPVGTGDYTGHLDPDTGVASVTVAVRIKVEGSYSGISLGDTCYVGDADGVSLSFITGTTNPPGPNTPITGVPYNRADGSVTLVDNSFAIPAATGCGTGALQGIVTSLINSQVGLPSASGNNSATVSVVSTPVFNPLDKAPLADAGPDQEVASGAPVTLDGSASSDPDSDPLTYAWSQTSGPSVTLSSASAAKPTFTAPAGPATLGFDLTVDDGRGSTDTDSVSISVEAPNHPPVADAGPDQSVASGAGVTLDGSGSTDQDSDPLTYAWSQSAGPTVTLSDPSAAEPTFTAPTGPAGLTFDLTVSDGKGGSDSDSVTVTVAGVNHAPTADAGPAQDVTSLATVTLTGLGSSDPDGDPLLYAWSQTSGPTVTLSSTSAAQPTFTAPIGAASLGFSLTVGDGKGGISGPSTVTVTVDVPARFLTDDAFVSQQYHDFLGRAPTAGERSSAKAALSDGSKKRPDIVEALRSATAFETPRGKVTRVYQAAFLRDPDTSGLTYWIGQYAAGVSLAKIATAFTKSAEFKSRYGTLGNKAFVQLIYQNILGRPGEASGVTYWTGQLDKGVTRGTVLTGFSESNEYKNKTADQVKVVEAYLGLLRRAPSTSETTAAVSALVGGTPMVDIVTGLLDSAEYQSRLSK